MDTRLSDQLGSLDYLQTEYCIKGNGKYRTECTLKFPNFPAVSLRNSATAEITAEDHDLRNEAIFYAIVEHLSKAAERIWMI